MAGDEGLLALFGVGQLVLKPGDVLAALGQPLLDMGELCLKRVDLLDDAGLGDQGALGQVLAFLGQGQFGLTLPFVAFARQIDQPALDLLALGDGLDRVRPHLDQGVFHLLDDQADQLLRIFGPIEDGIDVGVDDVGQTGKNAHDRIP